MKTLLDWYRCHFILGTILKESFDVTDFYYDGKHKNHHSWICNVAQNTIYIRIQVDHNKQTIIKILIRTAKGKTINLCRSIPFDFNNKAMTAQFTKMIEAMNTLINPKEPKKKHV